MTHKTEKTSTAWKNFLLRSLPTTANEAWHYTDLKKFLNPEQNAVQSIPSTSGEQGISVSSQAALTFIDGQFLADKSNVPASVTVTPLDVALAKGGRDLSAQNILTLLKARAERASAEHGGLIDLQQALLNGGALIQVPANVSAGAIKIQMQWSKVQQATLGSLTHLVILGSGAKLTLFEENQTGDQLTTTLWTHCELADNANLEYVRLQHNQPDGVSLNLISVQQAKNSQFSAVSLLAGGKLGRDTWTVDQVGEAADSKLKTLQLGYGKTQLDLRTAIHHQMPHGTSEQRARTVGADQSRVVFNGKIVIAKDAQLVNSSQLTQGLLLGERAEIDNKPQLEIYADNVKASHGATVGQMDQEELFYLQSRGLTLAQSQRMLGEGFARDVVGKVSDRSLRTGLEQWLSSRLMDLIESGMAL